MLWMISSAIIILIRGLLCSLLLDRLWHSLVGGEIQTTTITLDPSIKNRLFLMYFIFITVFRVANSNEYPYVTGLMYSN